MRVADRLRWLVVTGGGSGAVPVGPGTAGSLVAVGVCVLLDRLLELPWWGPAALAGLALVTGLALVGWSQRFLGVEDPPSVVIDEFAGQWLALAVPLRLEEPWLVYALGFVAFRFFDILKPLGVGRLERVPGAGGVMLDDVLAGAYALALIWGGHWLVETA